MEIKTACTLKWHKPTPLLDINNKQPSWYRTLFCKFSDTAGWTRDLWVAGDDQKLNLKRRTAKRNWRAAGKHHSLSNEKEQWKFTESLPRAYYEPSNWGCKDGPWPQGANGPKGNTASVCVILIEKIKQGRLHRKGAFELCRRICRGGGWGTSLC